MDQYFSYSIYYCYFIILCFSLNLYCLFKIQINYFIGHPKITLVIRFLLLCSDWKQLVILTKNLKFENFIFLGYILTMIVGLLFEVILVNFMELNYKFLSYSSNLQFLRTFFIYIYFSFIIVNMMINFVDYLKNRINSVNLT